MAGEERKRLSENRSEARPWHRWGPYLSERQWGTVREDYSAGGNAWDYFPHDHARSRAYRWGEDGIGGFGDRHGHLNLAVAFWNGKDPILKERFFGLTNSQGNHGEDVKECYWYTDGTPTHSYMKMRYRYPQNAFPYRELIDRNATASRTDGEFELEDTGIFAENRYFDIDIEYAKRTSEQIYLKITVHNCGPEDAPIWVLPTLWFRNRWSWSNEADRPGLACEKPGRVLISHQRYGERYLLLEGEPEILFTENETNSQTLFNSPNRTPFVKDAFHRYVVEGEKGAVNPVKVGTKAAAFHHEVVPAGKSIVIRVALSDEPDPFPEDFEEAFADRKREAEDFYVDLAPNVPSEVRQVQCQAFAGLMWSKQFYHYDVGRWLEGDPAQPPPAPERNRNNGWRHFHAAEILSMPDTWEYPWFASWDLAFHTIPLSLVDPDFAKHQLILLLREWYMHPSGQIPAYEWAFSDANPPVHAWAAFRIYNIEGRLHGKKDVAFLERVFHKLLLNFTWWVNREDAQGNNVFEGGFLGLDNIGLFDRNAHFDDGTFTEQSDGTAWMAMFCLNMLEIALELATHTPSYEDVASKFFEHFMYISQAMNARGLDGFEMWDERDGFFYDVLRHGDKTYEPLRVRSAVGLIPLFATATLDPEVIERFPHFRKRMRWFMQNRPDLTNNVPTMMVPGQGERLLLSLVQKDRLPRILERLLDTEEFLSPHGIRALSKVYGANPYQMSFANQTFSIDYEPGESTTGTFGGNSNWRGPIWFPLNYLLVESLQKLDYYYGDSMTAAMPTGTGPMMSLGNVAAELEKRLLSLFLPDETGLRPCDNQPSGPLLFHEYFHGDSGKGLGAAHQTGWTAVIAKIIEQLYVTAPQMTYGGNDE